MCFKNFEKFLGKKLLCLSKLQAYKLQPSVLRIFKIQKICKITSAVAALNSFSEKPQEGLEVYFKGLPLVHFTEKFPNSQKQLFADVLQNGCS